MGWCRSPIKCANSNSLMVALLVLPAPAVSLRWCDWNFWIAVFVKPHQRIVGGPFTCRKSSSSYLITADTTQQYRSVALTLQ